MAKPITAKKRYPIKKKYDYALVKKVKSLVNHGYCAPEMAMETGVSLADIRVIRSHGVTNLTRGK